MNCLDFIYNQIKLNLMQTNHPMRIVKIDTCKNGEEVATLENRRGQIEFAMTKNLPKEMVDEFKGEVRNIYKNK